MTAPDTTESAGTTVDAAGVVAALRAIYATGATRSLEARLGALEALDKLVTDHEQELLDAMHEDLGKSSAEGWLTELALVRAAIRDLRERLPEFMKPTRSKVPLVQRPGRAH